MPSTILLYLIMSELSQDPAQGLGGKADQETVVQKFNPKEWELVWKDDFENGQYDPDSWGFEEGYVRNGEAQYYTRARKENLRVGNGRLIIQARKDNWEGKPITSASLTTKGKREFRYGRIEAMVKIPTGRGTWPAVWTLGTNVDQVGWPKCGELDILENVGYDPDGIHANIHVDAYNHMRKTGKGRRITADRKPYESFNLYALEWYPNRVDFFFNEQKYFSFAREANATEATWPFDKPQYLILNLAIGGAWGGQQGIDDAIFPATMEVEYVKYFRRK
ncbi:MAG: glycoside hydrolase family 16 protein [Fimbriimonadaceae bacterium]|nr:glycoside hydrolase family 16 protein [Fimbriimonadaceae bacterium]